MVPDDFGNKKGEPSSPFSDYFLLYRTTFRCPT